MEELGQFIVNNGLGVASFFVLVYFMLNYVTKINDSLSKISETQSKISETLKSVEETLNNITKRVEIIETTKTKKGN